MRLRRLSAGQVDEPTYAAVHALVAEVAAGGGAVGWLSVPPPTETREWLDGVLAAGAHLLVAEQDGELVGSGHWLRQDYPVLRHTATLNKVMVAPAARGRGVARAVCSALVAAALEAGLEGLQLAARGNNHAALGLYTSLGFEVTGRRPDWIAVGNERFDEVLMHLDLRARRPVPPVLVRHGSRREGPGRT